MSVNEKMTALADAIREKSGVTGKLTIDGMTSAVKAISSLIVASASGNPIVLNDSTDLRVQSLRLFGKTTQNGTPTPDAPVPLVSAGDGGSLGVTVAGKNLVPNDQGTTLNHGVTFTANSDGSVSLNGTSSGDWPANVRLSLKKYPAGKYLVSGCPKDRKGTNARVVVGTMDGSVSVVETGNGATIEITKETELYFDIRTALGDVFDGMVFYPMMRLASVTDATYEPYKPVQTLTLSTPNGLPGIPVTSGGNYTDENGQQWICDEVDFGRGVYVQRVQHNIYCGNDEEAWYIADVTNNVYEELKKTGNAATVTETTGILPAISNKYISVSRNTIYTSTVTSGISNSAITKCIRVKDNRFTGTTSGEWAAWIAENPFEVIYKLATPNETPLSEIDPDALAQYAVLHTNYPNTTILNDGGAGMEVQYVADTKLYIDNKINAMAAAIVNA